MKRFTVKVKIGEQGEVEGTIEGLKGKACKPIAEILGSQQGARVVADCDTLEAYQQETAQSVGIPRMISDPIK